MNNQVAEEDEHEEKVGLVSELPMIAFRDHGERVDEDNGDHFIEQLKPLEQLLFERSAVDEIGELEEGEA